MITTGQIEARAAGCVLRRTLGAVLGGLAVALLLACEQQPAMPQTAAAPSQPAPEPPVQSVCVLDVAIHQTDTGGAIQGAIKDSVLYWAGTRSKVECLPQTQRQAQRVGNTEGNVPTYRVIRVRESVGVRYYMLKHVNGVPECIIDETGACTRKLSELDDDYDVETLPESVPEIGGGSETRPEPPATEPPTSGGAPASPGSTPCGPSQDTGTFLDAFRVRLSDGPTTVVNGLASFFGDSEGNCVLTNVTSSAPNIATAAIVDGNLQVTPLNPGTATIAIYASSGSNPPRVVKAIEVTVITGDEDEPAAPRRCLQGTLSDRFRVRVSDGTTTVVNSLADFFGDSEGNCLTFTNVTSSAPSLATAAIVDGNLQVTPLNPGTVTITIYASSGSNPPRVVKTLEITVITGDEDEPATPRRCGQGTLLDAFRVRVSDGTTTVVNSLADFFGDSEGNCLTFTNVTSSAPSLATAAIVDGNLQVTPLNPGTVTITIYASSGSNPPRVVKTLEVTVIP